MAECAAELLEPGSLLALLIRTPALWNLRDGTHGREHRYTSFEIAADLSASCSEPEFSALSHGMAAFAAVSIEHVFGKFLLAFVSGDHSIQSSRHLLRGGSGLSSRLG